MLNRRAFLARLGFGTVAAAAAATGVLDLERLLWVPGEKTIFLPSIEVADPAMCQWFAREVLKVFKNNLALAAHYNSEYADAFIGSTVRVALPSRYAH